MWTRIIFGSIFTPLYQAFEGAGEWLVQDSIQYVPFD